MRLILCIAVVAVFLSGCARTESVSTTQAEPVPPDLTLDRSNLPQADRTIRLLAGVGATADVEAKLARDVGPYVVGSGVNVATYAGPTGPIDLFLFRADLDGQTVLPGYQSVCWAAVLRRSPVAEFACGAVEAPWPERGVLGTSTSGAGVQLLVGSEVITVFLELSDGDVIEVIPAGRVVHASWPGAGHVERVIAVHNDGRSEMSALVP